MKKVILLVALFVSPVFAQEEEQEVEIQIEAGGGLKANTSSNQGGTGAIAAFPDKSVCLVSIF